MHDWRLCRWTLGFMNSARNSLFAVLYDIKTPYVVTTSVRTSPSISDWTVCPHVTQYQWLNRLSARHPVSLTETPVRTSPSISDWSVCLHVTQYQWLNRLSARHPVSVTEPSVRTSPSTSDWTVCPHVTQYQWLNRLSARHPVSVTEPSVAFSSNSVEGLFTKSRPVNVSCVSQLRDCHILLKGENEFFTPRCTFLGRFRPNSVQQFSTEAAEQLWISSKSVQWKAYFIEGCKQTKPCPYLSHFSSALDGIQPWRCPQQFIERYWVS